MTNPQFREEMGMKRETLLELLAEVEKSLVFAAKSKWNYTDIKEALFGIRMIIKILKEENDGTKA
jgi:hypothetical protein